MNKYFSRKFLISVAAFLGSIGATVGGFATSNEKIVIFGVVCTALSAAIYAGCEAYVDAAKKDEEVKDATHK